MNDYIPYEIRSFANQIDPNLDLYWVNNCQKLFSQLDTKQKEMVASQIFQKKFIYWDKKNNSFRLTKEHSFATYITTLEHAGMRNLAEKILTSCNQLEKYSNIEEIANFIEGLVSQVAKIDTEDNILLQKYKNQIKSELIYHIANIIKEKDNIIIPNNERQLNTEILKVFINEVYLKQQLLNFWFKSVPIRELKTFKHSLLKDFTLQQKNLRQLEIIKTSKFFFCLSQPNNKNVNTYSIRRFLNEEKSLISDSIYLNGVGLDITLIDNNNYTDLFRTNILKIVTIEKQISDEVTNFIENLQNLNSNILLPLLTKPLDSSGLNMEKVIEDRLIDFEKNLILNILEPTCEFLKYKINHQDESNYIFVSLKEIFSDILSYFKDFQSQPALLFDSKSKVFFYRLLAWLNLIEKRYSQIFIKQSTEDWKLSNEMMHNSITELSLIIKTSINAYKENLKNIKILEREIEASNGFIGKIFNTKKKKEENLILLKENLNKIKVNAFIDIIRVPKNHPSTTVYLEYEAEISINEKERNYAFSVGENGITRLPIMVQLPEDRSKFNLNEVYHNLNFDINLANQKWV
ncbi:hypothetical protein IF090_11810 [Acinetobacter towneri]|uniref:hypothetical protein n=1 Tax=Acinetobacter towneri TaxID=202956 RepID=UPI001CE15082|nr:hypothetical protein [Acinetobacter towneri]MCA4780308.1 hypothetical protein [Acinetobacter towneri]MCA4785700.1 hypothetical protein [Acinetobacter towneri]MCA4787105.1 hypothetical protein [Acinetobacter towneri]MCA4796814.1 hypothetical protein [Acinetobacter towneri]MCA4801861.1 hypothetical protein [Acinetobacter towneri]